MKTGDVVALFGKQSLGYNVGYLRIKQFPSAIVTILVVILFPFYIGCKNWKGLLHSSHAWLDTCVAGKYWVRVWKRYPWLQPGAHISTNASNQRESVKWVKCPTLEGSWDRPRPLIHSFLARGPVLEEAYHVRPFEWGNWRERGYRGSSVASLKGCTMTAWVTQCHRYHKVNTEQKPWLHQAIGSSPF